MVSNRQRRENGVGTEKDRYQRCTKIAKLWKVTIKETAENIKQVVIDLDDETKGRLLTNEPVGAKP